MSAGSNNRNILQFTSWVRYSSFQPGMYLNHTDDKYVRVFVYNPNQGSDGKTYSIYIAAQIL